MARTSDVTSTCCVALELSKTSWVVAFAPPGDGKASVHKIRAGDVDRLTSILDSGRSRAEQELGSQLDIVVCYEIGYDGFWLARLLMKRGIRTIICQAYRARAEVSGREAHQYRRSDQRASGTAWHLAALQAHRKRAAQPT